MIEFSTRIMRFIWSSFPQFSQNGLNYQRSRQLNESTSPGLRYPLQTFCGQDNLEPQYLATLFPLTHNSIISILGHQVSSYPYKVVKISSLLFSDSLLWACKRNDLDKKVTTANTPIAIER